VPDTAAPDARPLPTGWLSRLRQAGNAHDHTAVWLLHPARWGALALVLLLAAVWLLDRAPATPPGALRLDRAERLPGTPTAPPAEARGTAVTLPDVWTPGTAEAQAHWYRLRLTLPAAAVGPAATGPLLGVWLPQACAGFDLRVNGLRASQRGAPAGPVVSCLESALVALPPALLVAGVNTLDLRLAAPLPSTAATAARTGRLAPMLVAPLQALEPLHRHQNLMQVQIPYAMLIVAAITGLAALGMAALTGLGYLGYFGATSLGWAGLLALLTGTQLPGPALWTELLLCSASAPVAAAGILFLLRYGGLRLAWLEASLGLQCLIVPLTLLFVPIERLHSVAHPWPMILALELAAAYGVFLWRAWRLSRPDFIVATTALLVLLAGLAHEGLTSTGDWLLPGRQAIGLGLLAMLTGIGWRLHQLSRSALAAAEQASAEAEQRALDIRANMEKNFAQMAELRVEQVTTKERKRIAADLHDDLGAKLLTIVHTSDSERIATLGREALEEMRLSVRGLTGRAVQLGDAIGDWRSEVMTRLSQGGVELNWSAPDELLMSERGLSSRAYVQTTRILREAVSNVLKHSGASHCEVTIRQDDNDFELTISDNGKGIPTEMDGRLDRGHGMSTMKGRAKQLQGQCLVESGPGFGTTIRLTLPL
jgi:two-component system, NarL family, sensor histidine kinase UhpB